MRDDGAGEPGHERDRPGVRRPRPDDQPGAQDRPAPPGGLRDRRARRLAPLRLAVAARPRRRARRRRGAACSARPRRGRCAPTLSPVEAVASVVRDLTPGPLAIFLIHLVGTPRQAAAARRHRPGRAAVVCAYAAELGAPLPAGARPRLLRARRRSAWPRCCSQPTPGHRRRPGAVVGLVTWIVVLRMLTASAARRPPRRPDDDERRAFLKRAGLVVGVVAAAGGRRPRRRQRTAQRRAGPPAAAAARAARRGARGAALDVDGHRALADAQPGLLPHPHRARAALDLAGGLDAAHPRHGRPRDHA